MTAHLEARACVRRGDFLLDASLEVARGEVLAVLGPNGAGKSTVLAVLAGLVVPSAGHVRVGGRSLTEVDDSGRVRVAVPPERRSIGLLGQDALVFPHLSALDNVAFGPRAQGAPPRAATQTAHTWLEAVGLGDLAARRTTQLSGGQRQRIALARALAARPDVLLLDEPLAALDVHTAPEMRQVLREQIARTATTTVLVTHDVLDAVVLADRVIVLDEGRVIDSGPTGAVLAAPRNAFTAALAGLNLVLGTMHDGAVRAPDGRHVTGVVAVPDTIGAPPDGSTGAAVFAPSAVAVHTSRPHDASPRNVWESTVVALESGVATVRVRCAGDPQVVAELTPAAVAELGLHSGMTVWLSVKATEVALHRR